MASSTRDEEFSAFVRSSRPGLLRSACLLTAGDSHLAEDLVQTAVSARFGEANKLAANLPFLLLYVTLGACAETGCT
jgi:hypothetical protein